MIESHERAFDALIRMSERHPAWRVGQLLCNISPRVGADSLRAMWHLDDEDLVRSVDRHLQRAVGGPRGEEEPGQLDSRKRAYAALKRLGERHPGMRVAQMICQVAYWARAPRGESVWDVEDDEIIYAVHQHLESLDAGKQSPARRPAPA